MAKYLIQANYTQEGVKGLLKDGGSKRRRVVDEAVKALGGKVESFYYALGDNDVYVLVDAPDNVSVAALNLTVCAGGGARTKTTVLLTPEEVDAAAKKSVSYTAPGK
jgi:uncharacterized protein with GYD domain